MTASANCSFSSLISACRSWVSARRSLTWRASGELASRLSNLRPSRTRATSRISYAMAKSSSSSSSSPSSPSPASSSSSSSSESVQFSSPVIWKKGLLELAAAAVSSTLTSSSSFSSSTSANFCSPFFSASAIVLSAPAALLSATTGATVFLFLRFGSSLPLLFPATLPPRTSLLLTPRWYRQRPY